LKTRRIVLTYEDYAALPDDGRRYELFEGELAVTPAPSPDHQRALAGLNDLLRQYVRSSGLGEVLFAPLDVILSASTVVQPDLVYLAPDRAALVSQRGIEGPPTLVVEVLSPSTTRADRATKRQLYARYGVPYYWIVDPAARTVEAYVLAGEGYEQAAEAWGAEPARLPPFPDLALVAASIWR
jgi:Uma2 family endonuclease